MKEGAPPVKNPCANCIAPCEQPGADGECMGPVTAEQQEAIIGAIVYEQQHKATEKIIVENNLQLDA